MDLQATVQANEPCSDRPTSAIATFEDANLAAAVRAALSLGPRHEDEQERQDARLGEFLVGVPRNHCVETLEVFDDALLRPI